MKTTFDIKKIVFALMFILLFVSFFHTERVSADGTTSLQGYSALAPISGISDKATLSAQGSSATSTVSAVLQGIFTFAIGVAAAAAVFMIVLGGIQYMSTDSITGKRTGRDRIQKALLGLAIVISAWVILYTINPKTLSLSFFSDVSPTGTVVSTPNNICGYIVGNCSPNPNGSNTSCVTVSTTKNGTVVSTAPPDCSLDCNSLNTKYSAPPSSC